MQLLSENVTEGANSTQMSPGEEPQWVPLDTVIGLILAISSCLFIGVSVIFKKLALRDIEAEGGRRAVDGGYGYLRLPRWWLGISLMGLGELTNFVAYIFAPAILVTPLGVFSIVCTAALSPYFLKEQLGRLGKLGCVLVLVGCLVVTLCGPKDREIASMEELQSQLLHPGFLVYSGLVVAVSFAFMALVPRYGHRYVLLYITICSSFGSLSVMFCKGVGLALKQTIGGINEFTNWATWVCLVALVACLLIETIYMQRALDIFNSSVFMSINYVLFTSLVIVASSILYTELREIGVKNIILTLLGFVVNIAALYLMHLDREDNATPPSDEESHDRQPSPLRPTNKTQLVTRPEQVTPLLGRAPASPLASINLPHTMFPAKTNSCMSLISQASLPHRTTGDNHTKIPCDDDNHNHHHVLHDTKSTEGTLLNNNNKNKKNNNKNNNNSPSKASEHTPDHCRSSSGYLCEVPLLSELHASTHCPSPIHTHDDDVLDTTSDTRHSYATDRRGSYTSDISTSSSTSTKSSNSSRNSRSSHNSRKSSNSGSINSHPTESDTRLDQAHEHNNITTERSQMLA